VDGPRSGCCLPAVQAVAAALLSCLAVTAPAHARDAPAKQALAGRIFTVAGALRWSGPSAGSRLATRAVLAGPHVAAEPDGGSLIADSGDDQVLRALPDGNISRVAGGADTGVLGDGGPATSASLSGPAGVAPLRDGGFLIADSGNDRIRRVWPDGHISTVAGDGEYGFTGDGGPATAASLFNPAGVAPLADGGFLIADDGNERVRRVWPDGHISTVAGNGRVGFTGDGGPATRASLSAAGAVAAMPDGGFLIADSSNCRVRRVSPTGRISTVAGNGRDVIGGDGGPATSAAIGFVDSVAVVPGGGFLIGASDSAPGGVRRVWPDGHISSIVANAHSGPYGDGGPAKTAGLYGPDESEVSVAALPDGDALIGYGTSVRLVTGPQRTRLLAAAIRPLASVASRRAYRARVVLTRAANVTIRIYRSPTAPPVATARRFAHAGESTVTVRLGRRVTPGLYAVDLSARRGSRATRAEQFVYLGGTVTRRSIRVIEEQTVVDVLSGDPNGSVSVEKCHRFSALRVDCSIEGDFTFVEASWLTRHGQLRSRTYGHFPLPRFQLHPRRWNGRAIWDDLGAAWNPGIGGEDFEWSTHLPR
jgi:hypothetical protein